MKTKIFQQIAIFLILTAIAGGYFYYQGKASETLRDSLIANLPAEQTKKINASQVGKVTNGLVGYWTFDGADTTSTTASDKNPTATKNDGTLTGAGGSQNKPQPAIGKIGQNLNFDGTDDYVTMGNPANLQFDTNTPFSVGFWIKAPSNSSNMAFVSKTPAIHGVGWYIWSWSGDKKVRLHFYDGATQYAVQSTNAIMDGTWHYITATFDGSQNQSGMKMYIDGALNATGANAAMAFSVINSNPVNIGASNNNANFLNGKMDEVRIYNRAITASEVTELYQQGQTKINASQTNKLTNGLIAYYPMDGNYIDWSNSSAEIRDAFSTNHANATNLTTSNAAIGKIGQAINFQGTTGVISVADPGTSPFDITGSLTLSVWIKMTGDVVSTASYISKGGATFSFSIRDNGASDNACFKYGNSGNLWCATNVISSYDAAGGSPWYHIVGVYDHDIDRQILYINGAAAKSEDVIRTVTVSDTAFYVGDTFFPGLIDEARIYNRALSQSEVTELYNMGR